MRWEETESGRGKQDDGGSCTAEAQVAVFRTAGGEDPEIGEPRKYRGNAARLEWLVHRTLLRDAGEIVVLSFGVPWPAAPLALVPDCAERNRPIKENRAVLKAERVYDVNSGLEAHRVLSTSLG